MNAPTVMERLRAETADLHAGAESTDFQQGMAGGRLTRAEYTAWLGQMLHVHRTLERPLRELRRDPRFAALREEQFQEPYLLADLAALESAPEEHPALPATEALVAEIARASAEAPLALLGFHYVLEGSNNGNRFIAKRLVPALELGETGWSYLDPYGESQREKWGAFKRDMDAVGFETEQADALVAAARRMFQGIGEISVELSASRARS